jgi:hypothetical protein
LDGDDFSVPLEADRTTATFSGSILIGWIEIPKLAESARCSHGIHHFIALLPSIPYLLVRSRVSHSRLSALTIDSGAVRSTKKRESDT